MLIEPDRQVRDFFYSNFKVLKHSFRAKGLNSSSPEIMIDAALTRVRKGITSHEDDFHDTVKPYIIVEYAMYVHDSTSRLEELTMEWDLFKIMSQLREFQEQYGPAQGIQIVNGKVWKSEDIPT